MVKLSTTMKVSALLVANALVTMVGAQNAPCNVCGDGNVVADPDTVIDIPVEVTLPPGTTLPPDGGVTCGLLEQAALQGLLDAEQCSLIQTGIGFFCMCIPDTG